MIDRFTGEFAFLSNFHPTPLLWFYGEPISTVEHGFQAAKARTAVDFKAIVNAATPGKAKRMGRMIQIRDDWEQVKVGVMESLVFNKFFLNSDLREMLLATEDLYIVEGNHWGDRFWGVCDGRGENKLGHILMDVRNRMRGSSHVWS